MFGLFRTSKPAAPQRPTAQLNLETLESRLVPTAAISLNVTYNGGTSVTLSGALSGTSNVAMQTIDFGGQAWGTTQTDANGNYTITEKAAGLGQISAYCPDLQVSTNSTLTDTAPTIESFYTIEQPGGIVEFKGTFTYNYAIQGMTLTLNGTPVDVRNLHYSLDGSGTFDEMVQLNGQNNDNGPVDAVITDAWGVASEMEQTNVQQTGT